MKKLNKVMLVIIGLILCIYNRVHTTSLIESIVQENFNVITITRNKVSKYDEPLLLNEIFTLFKNVDQLLGGDCFEKCYDDILLEYVCNFYSDNLLHIAAKLGSNQHITTYYYSLYSKLINNLAEREQIFELLKTSLDCPSALHFKMRIRNIFSDMNLKLMNKVNQIPKE
jgi:hypothetical protein